MPFTSPFTNGVGVPFTNPIGIKLRIDELIEMSDHTHSQAHSQESDRHMWSFGENGDPVSCQERRKTGT